MKQANSCVGDLTGFCKRLLRIVLTVLLLSFLGIGLWRWPSNSSMALLLLLLLLLLLGSRARGRQHESRVACAWLIEASKDPIGIFHGLPEEMRPDVRRPIVGRSHRVPLFGG